MEVFNITVVPAKERFALWREVASKMWVPLDVRCEPHLESGFRARANFGELGAVRTTLLTATPLTIYRTPKLIRQFDPEAFFVTCVVRGRAVGEQDGRRAELHVGDMALRDSSRPYFTRMMSGDPAAQSLVLQFPRSLLPFSERDLRNLTAVRIEGDRGIGAMSSKFLRQLAGRMSEFNALDAARLSTITVDVITAMLASALEAQAAVPPHTRQRVLLAQIHIFIQENLNDSQLSPGKVAAAHHISLRYLHKLFNENGHTVAGWIRRRRLDQCRRDLADAQLLPQPITAIASRWGFASSAHFSRAFRSAYGLSPRQFRQQCVTAHADERSHA